METPRFVITIGRQFGAGGRELGQWLAKSYGIAYYDKELIAEVSKESGLAEEFIEKAEEKMPMGWMHALASNLMMGGVYSAGNGMPTESIFKFQADVIREIAKKQSCVIVGRCADYILRKDPLCISTFICASDAERVKRIVKYHGAKNQKEAMEMMKRIDKKREEYYNFYTDRIWAEAKSYDLCLDSSKLGIERSGELIREYVSRRIETINE